MKVIKQFGHKRSGTNYLRALLLDNVDAIVLTNGLGHKHLPPVNWRSWVDRHRNDQGRDASTACSPAVAAAVEANEVLATVSVKDPYGLCHSFIRYQGLAWHVKRRAVEPVVRDWAGMTNDLYEHWGEFVLRRGDLARFVRYEDLITNPRQFLVDLVGAWELVPTSVPFVDVAGRVEKGDRRTTRRHDRAFWTSRGYLRRMPDWAKAIVANEIDWTLFGRLGYSPDTAANPYEV